MTFRQALSVLWRQRLLIVAAVVTAVLAAGGYMYSQSPEYSASAYVQIEGQSATTTTTTVNPDLQLINGDKVVAAAAGKLGRQDVGPLVGAVAPAYDANTGVVQITATWGGPEQAVEIANAFSAAYIAALEAQVQQNLAGLQRQADKLGAQIIKLTAQSSAAPRDDLLKTQLASATALLSTLQSQILQAQIASAPASLLRSATGAASTAPSRSEVLALAATIGLLAGFGLALLRNQFDTRVRGAETVEAISDRPVLSRLPYVRSYRRGATALPVLDEPRSSYAESIRELRTSLAVLLDEPRAPVVVVTSPAPFDGKTLATASLATSYALSGKRTVLVSADLRHPRVHHFFDVDDGDPGLAELLASGMPSLDRLVGLLRPTRVAGLSVLPAGTGSRDPADGLASAAMLEVVSLLRDHADIVLLDCPPVLAVTDASIAAAIADGVLLVVRAGKTRQRELAETVRRLQAGGANILGVAFNRVKGLVGSPYGAYYRAAVATGEPRPSVLSDPAAAAPKDVEATARRMPAAREPKASSADGAPRLRGQVQRDADLAEEAS